MGDVKMMLMAGAFLGAKRTLLTIFAGSLLGSVLGIAFILARRKELGLRTAFRNFSRDGRAAGGLFRHASRELVPIDASDATMIKAISARASAAPITRRSSPSPGNSATSSPRSWYSSCLVTALVILATKVLRERVAAAEKKTGQISKPDTENASAFMAASMQGVIEKLRAQEKELARLHLLAQERAQESERLTEEVTRNMPTGLLLVNATGAIGSSKPRGRRGAGHAAAALPLVSRNSRRGFRSHADAGGVPARRQDVPSRRSGASHQGRRSPPPGRNDFSDLPPPANARTREWRRSRRSVGGNEGRAARCA